MIPVFTRADVIENAANHLADVRLAEFGQPARKVVPAVTDGIITLMHFEKTIELVRRFYALRSFTALQELLLAARTDKTLTTVMRKVEKSISARMAELISTIFPYWDDMLTRWNY